MFEEKWRVTHSKDKIYNYHYRYDHVQVGKYVFSNLFEGIMVVYNYNKYNMKRGEIKTIKN